MVLLKKVYMVRTHNHNINFELNLVLNVLINQKHCCNLQSSTSTLPKFEYLNFELLVKF